MEKKDRNKWANKFRELGKKKGSRSDFVKLSKEMKKHKEENKKSVNPKESQKFWNESFGCFFILYLSSKGFGGFVSVSKVFFNSPFNFLIFS